MWVAGQGPVQEDTKGGSIWFFFNGAFDDSGDPVFDACISGGLLNNALEINVFLMLDTSYLVRLFALTETAVMAGRYYVKSAQVLASKGDFMPAAWTRRLTPMFDDMPPKPWPQIEKVP